MARRRSDKGGGILIVIALIVAAVAVVGPFFIAGLAIVSEFRARRYRSASRASQLITREEQAELDRLETQVAAIDHRAQNIEREGWSRGLPRRTDGWFDGRNGDGRDLNYRLEALASERASASAACEALKDRLGARMDGWLGARAGVIGARTGLMVFVALFTVLTASRLSEHGGALTLPLLMFGSGADGGDRMAASAIATVAAALALWMARSIAKSALS